MKRLLGAFMMCLVPALFAMFLLWLGDVDHALCLEFSSTPNLRPENYFPSWSAALMDFTASLQRDLSFPLAWALMLLPYAGFSLTNILAQRVAVRTANLFAFTVFVGFVLLTLADPASHHDCDRKGTDQIFLFFLYAPAGLLIAAFVALISGLAKGAPDKDTA